MCDKSCNCKICVLYRLTPERDKLFQFDSMWWVVLTLIAVVHINLSIGVHAVSWFAGTGRGRFCCRLYVSIMQLLWRPGNGCQSPARSVALSGMDQGSGCQIRIRQSLLILRVGPMEAVEVDLKHFTRLSSDIMSVRVKLSQLSDDSPLHLALRGWFLFLCSFRRPGAESRGPLFQLDLFQILEEMKQQAGINSQ